MIAHLARLTLRVSDSKTLRVVSVDQNMFANLVSSGKCRWLDGRDGVDLVINPDTDVDSVWEQLLATT